MQNLHFAFVGTVRDSNMVRIKIIILIGIREIFPERLLSFIKNTV